MPDEDDIFQPELFADLQHVTRVSVEGAVLRSIVRREVRSAGADVIEEHDPIRVLEGRCHEAPHVLVAAEAVREEHRLVAAARDTNVVADSSGQCDSTGIEAKRKDPVILCYELSTRALRADDTVSGGFCGLQERWCVSAPRISARGSTTRRSWTRPATLASRPLDQATREQQHDQHGQHRGPRQDE